MNRPSQIACFISKGEAGFKVKVGGSAVIVLEGIMKF
jgi:predicted PhzF superfamily epimerase YddE/YHI9